MTTGACVITWQALAQEGPKGDPSCENDQDDDCDGATNEDDADCLLEITGVSPTTGSAGAATEVTLIGGGFEEGQTRVLFGELEAEVVSVSQSEIKVTTPITALAGLVDIRVMKSHIFVRQNDAFTFTAISDQ